jgi:prevent-host-death family protein
MPINITEDIRSVTDLKRDSSSVLRHVHDTKRPVVLTVNGKAEAVIMDAGEFEKITASVATLKELLKGEDDIASGEVTRARDFFKGFRHAKKI